MRATVVVVVAVVLFCAAFGAVLWRRVDRVAISFPGSAPGGTTYLLVGDDSRAFVHTAAQRTTFNTAAEAPGDHADVVILVRMTSGGQLRVLSIPRDLVVQLPDGAPSRLTMALTQSPQTLVDTLCHSMGVGVDHLVLIHMNGLEQLVDDVGGLTVQAPGPERDAVTTFRTSRAGPVHLDGADALAYVRSRHLQVLHGTTWVAVPPSVDDRSGRAEAVLSQVGARLDLSPAAPVSTVRNLWDLTGTLTVDSGVSPIGLRSLAHALGHLSTATQAQLPVMFLDGTIPQVTLDASARPALAPFAAAPHANCSMRLPTHQRRAP